LAVAMGLRFMGLANEIVNLAFGLILGSAAVACALAFGLGGRETAHQSLQRWVNERKNKNPPTNPPEEPCPARATAPCKRRMPSTPAGRRGPNMKDKQRGPRHQAAAPQQEAFMNKTARQNVPSEHADDRWPKAPTHADKGTGVMPMPDEAPDVAGRARRGRA